MALSGTDCMPNDRPSVRAGDAAGRARRFGRTGPRLAGDPHAWAQAFVPAPGESRPGSSRLAGAARLRGAAVPASLPPSRPGPALGGRRRDGAGSGAAGGADARRRRVPGVTMRGSVEKYVGGDRESGGMFRLTRSAGAGAKLEAAPTSRWPRRPARRTEAGAAWPAIRGALRRARVRWAGTTHRSAVLPPATVSTSMGGCRTAGVGARFGLGLSAGLRACDDAVIRDGRRERRSEGPGRVSTESGS